MCWDHDGGTFIAISRFDNYDKESDAPILQKSCEKITIA
ncbi:hypothetical protein SP19_124 [Salmonella phage 19]|nr:hypothetical protein SP19_124 [Salmonella phage 19]